MSGRDPLNTGGLGDVESVDLLWLASEWETLLSKIHYPSGLLAIDILTGLVLSFSRGRGLRMPKQDPHNEAWMWSVRLGLEISQQIEDHAAICNINCEKYPTFRTLWPEGVVNGMLRNLDAERESSQ